MHLSQNMSGDLGFLLEINGWAVSVHTYTGPEDYKATVSVQPMSVVKSGFTVLAEGFLAFMIKEGDLDKFSRFCKTDLEVVEFINSVMDLPTAKDYIQAMAQKTFEEVKKKNGEPKDQGKAR